MNTKDFEAIFHQHYSPLCNYASKILGDYNQAEEVVQSLFVQFLESNKLEGVDQLERYLIRSTKFKCIDHIRKVQKNEAVSLDDLKEGDHLSDIALDTEEEMEALFHFFVAKLSPKTREVFLLVRQSGYSYKEAAEELGVSPKTIENQMGSALKKLRLTLTEHGYIPCLYLTIFLE